MMADGNSRFARISDIFEQYSRIHKPVFMQMMLKEGLLEIITLRGSDEKLFDDEQEFHDFTKNVFDCINKDSFTFFKHKYLHYGFFHENIENQSITGLKWWLPHGVIGDSFYKKPGAIIVKDVEDYWIISLFSRNNFGKQHYKNEIKSINKLAERLDY